jgi:hypothetical protein
MYPAGGDQLRAPAQKLTYEPPSELVSFEVLTTASKIMTVVSPASPRVQVPIPSLPACPSPDPQPPRVSKSRSPASPSLPACRAAHHQAPDRPDVGGTMHLCHIYETARRTSPEISHLHIQKCLCYPKCCIKLCPYTTSTILTSREKSRVDWPGPRP